MLSDDSTYSINSEVTDGTTATYTHTLTVTGRLVGEYQCSVSNIRTPSGSSRSLTVVGKGSKVQHDLCLVCNYLLLFALSVSYRESFCNKNNSLFILNILSLNSSTMYTCFNFPVFNFRYSGVPKTGISAIYIYC